MNNAGSAAVYEPIIIKDSTELREKFVEHMQEMFDKLKRGETQPVYQIGAQAFTLEETKDIANPQFAADKSFWTHFSPIHFLPVEKTVCLLVYWDLQSLKNLKIFYSYFFITFVYDKNSKSLLTSIGFMVF